MEATVPVNEEVGVAEEKELRNQEGTDGRRSKSGGERGTPFI